MDKKKKIKKSKSDPGRLARGVGRRGEIYFGGGLRNVFLFFFFSFPWLVDDEIDAPENSRVWCFGR